MKNNHINNETKDLLNMIHFTEDVASKIYGVWDEPAIYRIIRREFVNSKKYTMSILLLTNDGSKLKIVESSVMSFTKKVKEGEKIVGKKFKNFEIDLKKSSIYRRAIKQDETIQGKLSDMLLEFLPKPMAYLIIKLFNYQNAYTIITPLSVYRKIIGVFAMSSHVLGEYFIPSVKNLAKQISMALELSMEYKQRNKLQQILVENEEKYRALVEDMPVLMCRFKPGGKLTFVNKAYCDYFNKKPEELIGQNFFQFIPENEREKVRNHYLSLNKKNPFITYEHKVIASDRNIRWQQWTDRALFFKKDKVALFQSIGVDITKIKIYEEKITKIKDELEKKNIVLREVLAQIELEKKEVENQVIENIEKLIIPSLNQLKLKNLIDSQRKYIECIENNLKDITSSFIKKISNKYVKLSSREIEICNMIKNGLLNKEIAKILSLSLLTVEKHREHIRKKLGITNKQVNLKTYLQELQI